MQQIQLYLLQILSASKNLVHQQRATAKIPILSKRISFQIYLKLQFFLKFSLTVFFTPSQTEINISQPKHMSPEERAARLQDAMPCHNYRVTIIRLATARRCYLFYVLLTHDIAHCFQLYKKSHLVLCFYFNNSPMLFSGQRIRSGGLLVVSIHKISLFPPKGQSEIQ